MATYRAQLPQLSDRLFLTDGGLETVLVFQEQIDLPCFASFVLLKDAAGTAMLRDYFRGYAQLAARLGTGLVLETATWRASADWGAQLGFGAAALRDINHRSVDLLVDVRREFEWATSPIVISGNFGPRGDAYRPGSFMSPDEACEYHLPQARALAETEADLLSAFTLTYPAEAIGIVRAAQEVNLPIAISFTVETDGRLPNGQTLAEAVQAVDAATNNGPVYYLLNCAHPTHLAGAFQTDAPWLKRLRGFRANASMKSHAELDEATELDSGNPGELGRQMHELRQSWKSLNIVGGCCGTDLRHIEAIGKACVPGR